MTTLVQRTRTQVTTDCRISLRQPIDRTGSFDGAWWPHSRDLAAELPALLAVFWTAGRRMTRVIYNLDSWDRAPRTMQIAGSTIRIGGYHYGDRHLMTVTDAWQFDTADLLIVPCTTDAATAERTLALVADRANHALTAQQLIERAAA